MEFHSILTSGCALPREVELRLEIELRRSSRHVLSSGYNGAVGWSLVPSADREIVLMMLIVIDSLVCCLPFTRP